MVGKTCSLQLVTEMAVSKVAVLLGFIALASALPADPRLDINWPEDRPSWWPESLSWPPQWPENAPSWWPESFPWPPQKPSDWPDRPQWWPDLLPWPPAIPDGWPDQPAWWPDSLPWPPAIPSAWPDRPQWWPDSLDWPPSIPDAWPDRPSFWPEQLPWPPALPEQWPDQPQWWPDLLPWPPALPEIQWPPPGVVTDRIPYIPSRDNQFHLFTRQNPSMSQPLVLDNKNLLEASNFDASRPTWVLVHDRSGSAVDTFNALMIPNLLSVIDANIIVCDWSAGARENDYLVAFYSGLSGNFIARFLNWVVAETNADLDNFTFCGKGIGGHNIGFIGLRMSRQVGAMYALDPSKGSFITSLLPPLTPNVARYTEVIHTDADKNGFLPPLGQVDFYPNGGQYQPGCGGNSECNRNRAVYFFVESITSGGFNGRKCDHWRDALSGDCHGSSLPMGGLESKHGERGVYYVSTNASPPFSQG